MPFGLGKKSTPDPGEPPDDSAPGWDAIDAAMRARFGDQEPLHWGSDLLPGQDGLTGLSAYRDQGVWFLVTYGLSELFFKESDDPTVSGWGFELTMRVPELNGEPPAWSRRLLAQLARTVFATGNVFAPGHRADLRESITGDRATSRLTAVVFEADPEFITIDTPNGTVGFLTVLGISADELAAMKASTSAIVLGEIADANPRLVTIADR